MCSSGSALAVVLIVAATPAFSQSSDIATCPASGSFGNGGSFTSTESVLTYSSPQILGMGFAGTPYSGQQTGQTVRTLANGTHLTQPANIQPMMYRDSMGRTRTDPATMPPQPGTNKTPRVTRLAEINDPVARYRYIIDDFHQIAHRIPTCKPSPPATRVLNQAVSPRPTGITNSTEDLGTQTMFGVTVTGQRSTTTFPPGTYQGNDAPVTTVNETWRSAQYRLDFLTKRSDPTGDTTWTMTNFIAGEPNPALFQIPAGYQIVDETAQFTITIPYEAE
jgi:hypothetical protein